MISGSVTVYKILLNSREKRETSPKVKIKVRSPQSYLHILPEEHVDHNADLDGALLVDLDLGVEPLLPTLLELTRG